MIESQRLARPKPPMPLRQVPPSRRGAAPAELLGAATLGCLLTLIGIELVGRLRRDPERTELTVIANVRDMIEREYVHGVSTQALVDSALHGMLEDLDDYSRFYDRAQSERLERETSGVYAGVGIAFVPGSSMRRVLFALPDSPADRAGIQPGDELLRLDGERLDELPPEQLRARLSAHGEEVELGLVRRSGELAQVQLVPRSVSDPSVRHARLLDEQAGLGYVAITSFSQRTAAEFDAALAQLDAEGLRGLVLDLRGNLGGVLEAALHVAEHFIASGVLVVTETRAGRDGIAARSGSASHEGLPLVVLVDSGSASSSEVLAGALQDHRVAVLVGERTYGKGTVQTLRRVRQVDGLVKLTTALFRTPSGRLIERSLEGAWDSGLAVDVEVPILEAARERQRAFAARYSPPPEDLPAIREWEAESGEQLLPEPPRDAQLEAALELLRGVHPTQVASAE